MEKNKSGRIKKEEIPLRFLQLGGKSFFVNKPFMIAVLNLKVRK
jgi:hypothetical protein